MVGIAQQRYAASGETAHAVESSHVFIGFPDFNDRILPVSLLLNYRLNVTLKVPNGKPARNYVRFRTHLQTKMLLGRTEVMGKRAGLKLYLGASLLNEASEFAR